MLRRSLRPAVSVLTATGLLAGLVLVGTGGVAAAQPTPGATATPVATPTPSPTSTASPSPSVAASSSPTPAPTAAVSAAIVPTLGGYPKFYRRVIKRGVVDGDVYHMMNVRELQYRLRWSGVYTGPVTGTFGPLTEAGVKAYQNLVRLRPTGIADATTWQSLIVRTTKALSRVPAICKRAGWHSCYDRASHQVFGFYNGVLWNVWLVRGGGTADPTNPGSFTVFARYLQKYSTIYGTLMVNFQKFNGGEGLHGSITMVDPFVGHSHGCVNMYIHDSWVLWKMTTGRTHYVTVYGAWA